ncbi:MAG: outer membrane beta-barrel protein [Gemmatimonadetes bacterium]|nr:outer membrane beta-barrel protein [Gemmatimonadota bacterium]
MSPRRSFAPTRRRLALAAAAALLASPASSLAQGSTTRGLSLGAHLMGTSLEVENGDRSGGGGFGLRVGYGFNRIVTGFVHLDGSRVEVQEGQGVGGQWDLAHAEVGARFHFANSLRRLVPYLEVSAGGRSVSVADAQVNGQAVGELSFSGAAVTFGGGLSAYFTRKLALDVSVKLTGGTFSKVDVGPISVNNLDIDAGSARFGVGFTWWPRA